MVWKKLNCSATKFFAASTSPDTTAGTCAMILGFGRPASAADFAMAGSMNSAMVRGPARYGRVPSASSPVTCNAFGAIAATYTGTGVPPATRTGHPGCAVISVPLKSTAPVSKMDLSTVKCSRRRVIVLGHDIPKACRSGSCPPNPRPRLKLPCDAACAVCASESPSTRKIATLVCAGSLNTAVRCAQRVIVPSDGVEWAGAGLAHHQLGDEAGRGHHHKVDA